MKAADVARFHADYDTHPDDRIGLFGAAAELIAPGRVLYPGSYVDIAPSVLFDQVDYVDTDARAAKFFGHEAAVAELVAAKRSAAGLDPGSPMIRFHQRDYREPLPFGEGSAQLLISLYAGLISEHCSRYLVAGGWLLVNSSHGDVAMAALDPGYELAGVIERRGDRYRPRTSELDGYLIPKGRGGPPTAETLRATNRGVAYTKSPIAYVFRRVAGLGPGP